MRGTGRTSEMWKKIIQLAQEGSKVLVCVHTRRFGLNLRDIPLDEEGTTIKDIAKHIGNMRWSFENKGQIIIHVPKQVLAGYRFDVVAIDHEAQHYFTVGEWWHSIETRLEPGGILIR